MIIPHLLPNVICREPKARLIRESSDACVASPGDAHNSTFPQEQRCPRNHLAWLVVTHLARERHTDRAPTVNLLLALRPDPNHHAYSAIPFSTLSASSRRAATSPVPALCLPPASCSIADGSARCARTRRLPRSPPSTAWFHGGRDHKSTLALFVCGVIYSTQYLQQRWDALFEV